MQATVVPAHDGKTTAPADEVSKAYDKFVAAGFSLRQSQGQWFVQKVGRKGGARYLTNDELVLLARSL